jgi:hypothetical protein
MCNENVEIGRIKLKSVLQHTGCEEVNSPNWPGLRTADGPVVYTVLNFLDMLSDY